MIDSEDQEDRENRVYREDKEEREDSVDVGRCVRQEERQEILKRPIKQG